MHLLASSSMVKSPTTAPKLKTDLLASVASPSGLSWEHQHIHVTHREKARTDWVELLPVRLLLLPPFYSVNRASYSWKWRLAGVKMGIRFDKDYGALPNTRYRSSDKIHQMTGLSINQSPNFILNF